MDTSHPSVSVLSYSETRRANEPIKRLPSGQIPRPIARTNPSNGFRDIRFRNSQRVRTHPTAVVRRDSETRSANDPFNGFRQITLLATLAPTTHQRASSQIDDCEHSKNLF